MDVNTITRSCNRRAFGLAAALAVALVCLMPTGASAAWSVGQPITMYWDGQTLDSSTAQMTAGGNFNTAWVRIYSYDNLDEQLGYCQQNNLRAMIRYDSLLTPASLDGGTQQAALDAFIARCAASPQTYMYYLADEPSASQFAGLGTLVSYLKTKDPNHASYINLLPNYATTSQWGTSTYATYLSQFVSTVHPEMLSYDNYNFYIKNGANYDTQKAYLTNLVAVRNQAVASGIPFMNTVQAISWVPGSWQIPTAAESRFLAYTTLAFSGQGLSQFSYANWNYQSQYTGGIVDPVTRVPTAVYTQLTPLNDEFQNVATQLQGKISIGTYERGKIPTGVTALPSNSPFYVSPTITNTSYTEGTHITGLLFGLFGTTSGITNATYCLLTNLDTTANKATTLYGPGNLDVFDATLDTWSSVGSNHYAITLLPGQGKLFRLSSAGLMAMQMQAVPEPCTLILLGTGLTGLLIYGRRKKA